MSTSPTQRTIRELKNQGRRCGIVERFISGGSDFRIRKDLFGIIDIIALDPEHGVVGIQSCGQDFSAHRRKILEDKAEEAIEWLETPGTRLELWGWRKVVLRRGARAMRWRPRIHVFTLEELKNG